MALRVFREMDDQARDGGGKRLAADAANVEVAVDGNGADLLLDFREDGFEIGEEFSERRAWCGLAAQELHLRVIEQAAVEVGGETVDAAGDVTQLEAEGCEAWGRFAPELLAGDAFGEPGKFLARLLEGVEEMRRDGMQVIERSAKPRFGHNVIVRWRPLLLLPSRGSLALVVEPICCLIRPRVR